MDTIEVELVELVTDTEAIVEIDSALPETVIDITKSISVEVQPETYVLTSDGIYTGRLTTAVPTWLITAMQQLLTTGTGNVTDAIQELRDALDLLEVGVSQHTTSILTTNESFNSLETSVVSRLNNNEAAILDIYTTKVDAAGASAIATSVISSTFGGNADAYIANIASTYTNANSAVAANIEQLYASYNNTAVSITALDEVVVKQAAVYSRPDDPSLDVLITLKVGDYWIDTDHPTRQAYQWNGASWDLASTDAVSRAIVWSANSSKLITDPNGNITGWAMSDSSTTASEFKVYADNFIIQGATNPIEYDNSAIVLPKTYEQSSTPTSGVLIGDTWIDTDDSYKVYIYTSTGWKATVGNKTFAQTTQPSSGMITNDIWYDTDDNNKPYYYNGSSWSAIRDGTIAIAQTAATAAQTTANTASTNATSALTQLTDIASDNILSPVEKSTVIADYAVITAEQSGIDAQATSYAITTEKTAYDTAVTALTTYLNTLRAPVAWNVSTGNTTIVASTFRSKFSDVYTTRQTLLNAISAKAKLLADTAQSTADTAYNEAIARVLPAGVANAINTNTTTINGSKITTGSIAAAQLNVNAIIGKVIQMDSTNAASSYYTSDSMFGSQSTAFSFVNTNRVYGICAVKTNSGNGSAIYGLCNNSGQTGAAVVGVQQSSSTSSWGGYFTCKSGTGVLSSGNTYDFYASGVGVNYGPFTGGHDAFILNTSSAIPGDIVSMKQILFTNGVSQTSGEVELADTINDKRVAGVYNINMDLNNAIASMPVGADLTVLYNMQYIGINSIGEGMVNVCDSNGDISNGEYITSSTVPGKGMKQSDDILHSYTVAKSMESVVWANEVDGVNGCYMVGVNKVKMVACTYHCG